MNLREAAQQALEVLERAGDELQWQSIRQAQQGLCAALAKQRPNPDSMKDVYASLRKKAMRSRI